MGRTKVAVGVFAALLLLVIFPLGISEIKEGKEKIRTLETDLLREKADHKKASEHYQQEKEKVEGLNSQVNALEDELGNARAELGEAQQETKAAKEEAAAAQAEVEKLKKAKASAVKKPPAQEVKQQPPQETKQAAPIPQTKEESKGNGGRKVQFVVTAYGADCAGCQGKTASGTDYAKGRTIAAPPQYAFGTKIEIPELGGTFTVEDRGGAIQGNRLDLFYGTEAAASGFGVRVVEGIVYD